MTVRDHLPLLWRYRLLRGLHAKGTAQNRRVLLAQQLAEGGSARWNPLNTSEPWPGSTDYNTTGVRNYPTGAAGIAATVATFTNGHYPGIVRDLRLGSKRAEAIVRDNADEYDTWGTGADHVLAVLARLR